MLSITNLNTSLDVLEAQYQQAITTDDKRRICKHALLELCGWIEQAQDHIVSSCLAKLVTANLIALVNEKIQWNSGFSYKKNFLPLLGLVIGFQNYEKVAANLISPPNFSHLEVALNSLKADRNMHAHTHFDPSHANVACLNRSPAVLKTNVSSTVFAGMSELETELIAQGLI